MSNIDKEILSIEKIEQIQDLKVNEKIVREALNQSEKKLIDFLENKKNICNKIFILFNVFISILIALVSAVAYVTQHQECKLFLYFIYPFGALLFLSVLFCLLALKADRYGSLGTKAGFWLRKDILEGNSNTLTVMLGYVLYSYKEKIETTYLSNEKKIRLENTSVALSILGFLFGIIFFLLQYHCNLYGQHPYFFRSLAAAAATSVVVACYLFPKRL